MTAHAHDRIWWAPIGTRVTLGVAPIHWCSAACITHLAYRDQLDPMALGTCRYCGESLPTPRTSGGNHTNGERRSDA